MSARVTVNIGFYFENEHYAQLHAYLPRSEVIKIPELNLEEEKNPEPSPEAQSAKPSRQANGSKKASEEDIQQEDDNDNFNEMEIENEEEEDNEIDQEQQQEVQNALQELEQEEVESDSSSSNGFDSQREDQEDQEEEEDIDDDSLSQALPTRRFLNNKTKRQKGQTKDLIQLPDRRPRKNKNVDEATQIIRRQQKERKRKQYLKKQIQAHEKATIDKILNETGRKLKQREEKEMQEEMERQQKSYKTLGDVPKIITLDSDRGKVIMTHKTGLFPSSMTTSRDLKMKEMCSRCGKTSKYRLKGCEKYACSLPCYKELTV